MTAALSHHECCRSLSEQNNKTQFLLPHPGSKSQFACLGRCSGKIGPSPSHMRIVIAEDHELIAEFLRGICEIRLGHRDVAVARCGSEAISLVLANRPELVLLDLGLPDIDGFSVVDSIRANGVFPRVVALSGNCNAYTVGKSDELGIDGFVDKNTCHTSDIARAISAAGMREKYFSDSYLSIRRALRSDPFSHIKVLSNMQQTVLRMISFSLTDEEIGALLGRSRHAAEKHRFRILGRLGLKTMHELAQYALKSGFGSLGLPSAKRSARELSSAPATKHSD
jgi:DNA-binding NarL/FixJ family response regulator